MRVPDTRERFVWVICGVLLVAWVLFVVVNFITGDFWRSSPPSGTGIGGYGPIVMAAAFVLIAAVIAWLLFALGRAEWQKQAAMERQFRLSMQEAYLGTLQALTGVLDLRDDETYGHSRRVMGYSLAIGRNLGLSPEELQTLAWGALLHDLGKIGIGDEILLKRGPLTVAERARMNQHVVIGQQLVHNVPFLSRTAAIIRHHHEQFDGNGYPDHLAGERIPLLARIFAVADAFDAMTSSRPYRLEPLDMEKALAVIHEESGKQFCPGVVGAFELVPMYDLEQIRADSFLPEYDLSALTQEVFEKPIAVRSFKDPLTGAYTREVWAQKAAQMGDLYGPKLGTLIYVDIVGLRQINHFHGRLTGDRILGDLGSRLLQVGPELYRLGGDELHLWMPQGQWSSETGEQMAEALAHFQEYWHQIVPGISVNWGYTSATAEITGLEGLVANADHALIKLKASKQVGDEVVS